jgi:hypothetical protein
MSRTRFALLWAFCVSACCASAAQDGSVSPAVAPPPPATLRRFEIGVDSAAVRTPYTGQGRQGCCPTLSLGLGASINIDHRFAIDTKLITTPGYSTSVSNFYGGRITEFLSGARAEIRARRYGYFVRAQAGFLSWDHVVTKVLFPTPNTFAFEYGSRWPETRVQNGPTACSPAPVCILAWAGRLPGGHLSMRPERCIHSGTRGT